MEPGESIELTVGPLQPGLMYAVRAIGAMKSEDVVRFETVLGNEAKEVPAKHPRPQPSSSSENAYIHKISEDQWSWPGKWLDGNVSEKRSENMQNASIRTSVGARCWRPWARRPLPRLRVDLLPRRRRPVLPSGRPTLTTWPKPPASVRRGQSRVLCRSAGKREIHLVCLRSETAPARDRQLRLGLRRSRSGIVRPERREAAAGCVVARTGAWRGSRGHRGVGEPDPNRRNGQRPPRSRLA